MGRRKIELLYLIDDSEDELFMTKMYFKRQKVGLELKHFPSFEEFYDAFGTGDGFLQKSAVIVIDMNLTLSRGTDGVRTLKELDIGDKLVAGICTGSDDPADRHSAAEAGADFYVGKPLNLAAIEELVAAVPGFEMETDKDERVQVYSLT